MKFSKQFLLFVNQFYGRIVTGLAVVFFMMMITGIREFVNDRTIYEATENTIQEQNYRKEKIDFEKNFLLPYLESSTAEYFFAHENGSLFPGEKIVQFRQEDETREIEKIEQEAEESTETVSPSQARDAYIEGLFSDIH